LTPSDKVKAAAAGISELGSFKVSSPKDAENLKSKLEKLNGTKDDLEKSLKDVQALKSQAESDLGSEKDLAGRINELKDKDIKALSDKYKIPTFSTGGDSKIAFRSGVDRTGR